MVHMLWQPIYAIQGLGNSIFISGQGVPKMLLSSQTQNLISATTNSKAIYQKNHQKKISKFFMHIQRCLQAPEVFRNFELPQQLFGTPQSLEKKIRLLLLLLLLKDGGPGSAKGLETIVSHHRHVGSLAPSLSSVFWRVLSQD